MLVTKSMCLCLTEGSGTNTERENLLINAYAKKADREISGAEAIKKESAFLCSLLLFLRYQLRWFWNRNISEIHHALLQRSK